MKLLILNIPPKLQREECCWGPTGRDSFFPFLLAQIATVLEKEVEIEFFDANCENATFRDIEKILLKKKPDAVVCSLTPQYMPLEAEISEVCLRNSIKCIAIPIPFDYAEEIVRKYDFYFAIYSEPEKALLDWCRGTSLEKLKGIVYKVNNRVIKNPPQHGYYSKCPPINWDRFDLSKYMKSNFLYQVARGCPYSCKFCVWAKRPWQLKPVETVITDLKNLERRGIWMVHLLCAQITTDKKWLRTFCEEKRKRGIRILWRTDIRANEVNRDIIRSMRDAGCVGVYMGVESLNQQILDGIDKELTVNQILDAINVCVEEGIPLTFPILFNIGENENQVKEYIHFIKKTKVPSVSSGIVKAYKGTKFYEELDPTDNAKILEWGVIAIPTLNDLPNAQKRLKLFRKEKKKLFPIRTIWMLWWQATNRNARKVFVSVLKRGGIKGIIFHIVSTLADLYYR